MTSIEQRALIEVRLGVVAATLMNTRPALMKLADQAANLSRAQFAVSKLEEALEHLKDVENFVNDLALGIVLARAELVKLTEFSRPDPAPGLSEKDV